MVIHFILYKKKFKRGREYVKKNDDAKKEEKKRKDNYCLKVLLLRAKREMWRSAQAAIASSKVN